MGRTEQNAWLQYLHKAVLGRLPQRISNTLRRLQFNQGIAAATAPIENPPPPTSPTQRLSTLPSWPTQTWQLLVQTYQQSRQTAACDVHVFSDREIEQWFELVKPGPQGDLIFRAMDIKGELLPISKGSGKSKGISGTYYPNQKMWAGVAPFDSIGTTFTVPLRQARQLYVRDGGTVLPTEYFGTMDARRSDEKKPSDEEIEQFRAAIHEMCAKGQEPVNHNEVVFLPAREQYQQSTPTLQAVKKQQDRIDTLLFGDGCNQYSWLIRDTLEVVKEHADGRAPELWVLASGKIWKPKQEHQQDVWRRFEKIAKDPNVLRDLHHSSKRCPQSLGR